MLDPLDQLATEMFRTFAQFEFCASRQPAFTMATVQRSRTGVPSHTRFPIFLTIAAIRIWPQLCATFLTTNGFWHGSNAALDTDLQSDRVLLYVRRVRNNLFRGGKVNGGWFEPERGELLLRHSLTILRACIAASEDGHRLRPYRQDHRLC